MVQTYPTLDPECARTLATLIRENLDDLVGENSVRYSHDYAHSVNNSLDEATKRRWTEQELLSIAEQLESGEVDPQQYEGMRGDIVLQNEELLYPIDAFLEMTFYISRMIADLVWEKNLGDTRTLNALLATLEAFVQLRTVESLQAFTEQICQPRALVRTWQLGRRWAKRSGGEGGAAQEAVGEEAASMQVASGGAPAAILPDASLLDQLTSRELEMARLVAEGRSNNEVASALGLQLSTVRNTLSRVYMKLGIASRAELIVALARSDR